MPRVPDRATWTEKAHALLGTVHLVGLGLALAIGLDATLIRRSLGRLMAERLPGESTRGLTMYAVMRALQIRRFRVPTPRVHPGDKI